jgi:two-component system alkaline phosphatase synthesis response regulator PhoP
MSRGSILLVEDDRAILAGLEEKLRMEGYEAFAAVDGEEARDKLAAGRPDLVVLDLMLPKLDGISVLKWLRKRYPELPVLILSAKGREEEKVEGLRAGADDYLAKPFGLKELVARIEALLRRARGPDEPLSFGDVSIDFRRRKVFRKKREVPLSRKELEVLFYLARNRSRIVTREEILDHAWGYYASSAARAVDFHILNLRRKLEVDPADPRHLLTRHGLGYQLAL